MSLKATTILAAALCALVNGHAISEQKVIRYYGKLGHIGDKAPEHHEEYAPAYPAYEFSYRVEDPHTHDMKGQHESRDGDVVKGQYWLIQPDGLKRTVTYHADKHGGFKAHVEYSDPHLEKHVEDVPEEKHKPIVDYKLHHEHKPVAHHIEHKPHVEHKIHVENKPHVDHKPLVEPKAVIEHRPHFEHKPIVDQEPHYDHLPYSYEPIDDHKKEAHVPIPLLSAYTPRFHKDGDEHYRRPREYRRRH